MPIVGINLIECLRLYHVLKMCIVKQSLCLLKRDKLLIHVYVIFQIVEKGLTILSEP